MARIGLSILGGFELTDQAGAAIALNSRKGRALFAYLALNPDRRHGRGDLAALLWGGTGEAHARNSLNKCLRELRNAFGADADEVFENDRDGVSLRGEALDVDAAQLRRLAESEKMADLAAAAQLYGGELLAGLVTADQPYEDWLRLEREATRKTALEILSRLAQGRLASGEAAPAAAAAERLVALDPLDEQAQRLLMRAYGEAGQRSAALEQYRACAELLHAELGVEPEAETKALLEKIATRAAGEEPLAGSPPAAPEPTPERDEDGAEEPPTPPDKPSIAVLAFENMSGDPEQDYFADGIAEDIITALSRFRSLFVIARNSSFTYKGRAVDVTEVAREMGVRYVVEGSVRQMGERLRITAQLIDAASGNHLWAERFDGNLEDVFDLQDRITEQIVVAVEPEIKVRERERARRKAPESLDAWALVQRGLSHSYRANKSDHTEAIRLFEEAVALDPDFAAAHAQRAYALFRSVRSGYAEDTATTTTLGRAAAETAIFLDPNEALAHFALGRFHTTAGETEMAIGEMQTAIVLNPNFAWGHYGLAFAYHTGAGQAEQALPHYDTALRLSPRDPLRWTMLMLKGSALRLLGRHDEAIAHGRQACQYADSGFAPHLLLAAALAEAGQINEARARIEAALQLQPTLSINFLRSRFAGEHESIIKSLHNSLRKAGLSE